MGSMNEIIYNEPKPVTKQIPLFEEQDDGNLIPYSNEEWIYLLDCCNLINSFCLKVIDIN